MKKHLILAGLLLLSSLSISAQRKININTNRSDSLATQLYKEKQYGKAADVILKEIEKQNAAGAKQDTAYIDRLIFLAKSQYRAKRIDDAIATSRTIVDLYGKNISNKDKSYAFALDNLALYLSEAEKYDEAEKPCKEALTLYESFQENDADMAYILLHYAEILAHLNNPSGAISYELRALNIYKKLYGEHSKEYTNEAAYLQKYYEQNGDKDKAEKLKDRIAKLEKETEDGEVDLPDMVKFTSPTVASAHDNDMLRIIDYFFNHKLSDPKLNHCAAYIMDWTAVSDKVSVEVGGAVLELTGGKENCMGYMVAFMAACDEYALDKGEKGPSFDMFAYGMSKALNFYQANRSLTGEIEYNEKLIKTYTKGKDKYMEKLKELYDADHKDMQEHKENVVKMKAGDRVKVIDTKKEKGKKKKSNKR